MKNLRLIDGKLQELSPLKKLGEKFEDVCLFLLPFLGWAVAISILGWQTIHWLQTGQWVSLALKDVMTFGVHSWIAEPHSWYGLHKMVVWLIVNVPLALWSIICGFILGVKEK